MGVWDQILHTPKLGGVGIDLERRNVRGGRMFARHQYPYRDGQQVEDTGRAPFSFELSIPLHASIDSSDYPDKFEQLRSLVENDDIAGEVEYVDPIMGPIDVKIVHYEWEDSARVRDGCTLRVRLEEATTEAYLQIDTQSADPQSASENSAASADSGLADTGVTEDAVVSAWADAGVSLSGTELDFSAGQIFLSLHANFFTELSGASFDSGRIGRLVDTYRARLDAVAEMDEMRTAAAWSVRVACIQMADSMTQAAEAGLAALPPVITWTVPRRLSSMEIAVALYGDNTRREEVELRNPVQNPLFYNAGSQVRVLAA